MTMPDLSYAINTVCQYMHQPTMGHYQLVKHILHYVSGTITLGILILAHNAMDLYALCDADWAGCPTTRRLSTWSCTFLGSICLSWSAKKQPTIARSSTEAGYRAMASATAELT